MPQARPQAVKKNSPLFFGVLVLALLIRVVYWFTSQNSPFYAPMLLDAHYYDGWARQIAVGNLGEGVFYGLPLYPFFLGVIYKLTVGSFVAAKWVQIVLGVATVGLIYKIGRELFDSKVALVSALLAAIYGPLFFHEAILIPESIGVPLYALAFLWAIRFWDAPSIFYAVRLGIVCALAALTKAGILMFVALFLIYGLLKRKPIQKLAIFGATALLFLLPVTLHNVVHGKDLVFLTAHSGLNFYVGNNPSAEGTFNAPEGMGSNVESQRMDSKAIAEREMGRELKPSEVSHYWSEKGWKFIRSNPGKFLELCGRKLILFFDSRELSDVDDYSFGALFNSFLKYPWPNFGALVLLLFAGVLVVAGNPKRDLILLWVGAYLIGMMFFFVNARYRLPMLSIFIPIAGAATVHFYEAFKKGDWARLILFVVLAAAGFGVSHVHLVGTDPSRNFVNAGDALTLEKKFQSAQSLYEEAIKLNPENAKAQLAMGLNMERLGRTEESKKYYLKVLDIDPGNYQAHNNLGLFYAAQGDEAGAFDHFNAALSANPNSFQAHNNLGMLYGKRGDVAAAAKEFEESIRINPAGARAYSNLGLIRYKQGDRTGAKALWEKALSVDPGFEDAKRALSLLSQAVSP